MGSFDEGETAKVESPSIKGIQRAPHVIGYDPKRHLLIESSLLEFSSFVETENKLPEWVKQVEEWTDMLLEKKLRMGPLVRGKKERKFGADLIFQALPTGFRPMVSSQKVPRWNKWDPTLPLFFFCAATNILTNLGLLVLLYSGDFEHVTDVVDSLCSVKNFESCGSWSVALDRPVYRDDREILVSC